jgi:arylsulfatase A-like enzyme
MKLLNRKHTWALLATLWVAATAVLPAAAASPASKPNIIFFLVDDMGWQETSVQFHTEVTALNRRYRTPNMERLAAEGVKFTQAYASAVCSPTRVSALTGMNVARHRVTNWTLRKDRSPDNPSKVMQPPEWNLNGISTNAGLERTIQVTPLPALLREAGYHTIHVGKAHFGAKDTPGENPLHFGFDINIAGHAAGGPGSYWGEKNFSAAWRTKPPDLIWDVPGLEAYHGSNIFLTEALTLEAIKAVEKTVRQKQPFYLYMAHYAVHAPWEKDERFYPTYVAAGLKPFEATLASMIEGMDKSLGDLMAALTRLGVADNTIILFMSDNGAPSQCPPNLPLRGHKLTPYEGGIREPMLVKWPGVTKPGTVCREPVVIEDFFPTILELAGAKGLTKTVQTVDGVSFVPQLKAADAPASNRAFVWHFPHNYGGQGPFSAIRVGAWKLIYHHTVRKLELFNLEADISEQTDLAAKEPQKVHELAVKLAARLKERGAQMPLDKLSDQIVPWPDEVQAPAPVRRAGSESPGAPGASKPNIVFVLTDDQRWDAAGFASGGAVWSPGLDKLRSRSVQFTRAYAAFSLCSPSRAAILSSEYGTRNGVNTLDGSLNRPQDSFAEVLRSDGYQTAVCGKWHLKTTPKEAGFDWAVTFHGNGTWHGRAVNRNGTTVKPKELVDAYCAGESVQFLRERDKQRPFFLWHCSQLPHMDHQQSWPATAANLARYEATAMPLPNTWKGDEAGKPEWVAQSRNRTQAITYGYDDPAKIREHTRAYRATIGDLDDALQPLWAELDTQHLWENTIVVFMSDNGWMLGEHGLTSKVLAYEPSARVPLLIAAPGLKPGRSCDRLVCNLDIAPTLLEFAGLAVPPVYQGRSLRPLLVNPQAPFRTGFLYEGIGGYGNVPPMGAWITERWKIIHTWGSDSTLGETPKFVERYDLQNDPEEAKYLPSSLDLSKAGEEAAAGFKQHSWKQDIRRPGGRP